MDLDEIRGIVSNSGTDIWGLIEAAIEVASIDYYDQLQIRRDGLVGKLHHKPCLNCNGGGGGGVSMRRREIVKANTNTDTNTNQQSPSTPVSDDEEGEHHGQEEREKEQQEIRKGRFGNHNSNNININSNVYEDDVDDDDENVDIDGDDEQRRIISIKEQIEDPRQTEDSLVDLLQSLADMDITFKALKETDIGRYVNRLRKHPSNDVKRLVKVLVRKWKDLVDEWVRLNTPGEVHSSTNLIADGDSPLGNVSKNHQNGHHSQVPDFAYSPNPHNGSSGSDRYYSEPEPKPKVAATAAPAPRRDPPSRPTKSPSAPASAPPPNRQKEVVIDPDRLASARKRLQENYQEAQNAKKQRTIQVMDIHEIPKPKNSFFGRNKGGFQRH